MTYEELVAAIGPGFHPDTREYTSLPDGLDQASVNIIVDEAFVASNMLLAADPYARALGVFVEKGWA